MRKRTAPIERLLRRCVEGENGCWLFQGATKAGYGVVGLGGRSDGNALAHRLTFTHFIGPVPDGLDLDHLCRVRQCCNPWHLEPVTRLVNANRGLRGTGYRDSHCKNGHEYTPENTRMKGGYRRCVRCLRATQRASSQRCRDRRAVA